MAKMTKDELRSACEDEIFAADQIADLQKARADAMDYYLGEPFGNEIEGRSKVVSTDVQECIEWIMPSIMRIFTSTDKAVAFEPETPEDEDGAKQESDMVNHVFYKENNGFIALYTFFKDALMQKNGVIKYWWDGDVEKTRETYEGLNDIELSMLDQNENVDLIEHEQDELGLHNVTVIVSNKTGKVSLAPVPPEEFMISSDATSVDPKEARFVCHRTLKTRPEMIAMGFSKRLVDQIPTYSGDRYYKERDARDNLNEDPERAANKHAERIRYDECYIRIDFDGDGIAELREVGMAGNKILLNKEVDECPFAAITPIILSHKFYGLSVADTVMDLQLIRSTLLRGVLDNTYNANNSRTAAQEGRVNLDDLLTSRPGGIVRTDGPPSQVLMPIPHNPLPQQTFQVLEQTEKMRKERTGVGQETMGLEANVLAHGRTGVINQSFDMARMRVELIARVFAETGVKQLFLGVHKLLQQNQDKPKWMKMRGEWIPVNPSEWRERTNMTVNVGLGTGNKDKESQNLMAIIGMQEKLLQVGQGVTPKNVYDTLEKLVESFGYRNVETFFTDPDTQQPPEKEPSPEELIAKAQVALLQNQIAVANKEADTNRQEAIWKHEEKMKELTDKDARERTKMELDFQTNVPGAVV